MVKKLKIVKIYLILGAKDYFPARRVASSKHFN